MAKFSFRKIAVAALSAVGLSALSFGAAGCLPKSTSLAVPENAEVSRTAPPADGSLPTAHTCAENLSYIIYVFDHQEQYHTYSYGVTSASIATQTTRNFRDYKNGILLNTDLTYSSMVKSGTQTCSMYNEEGEYEVYFRTSEAPEADTLPSQAVWSQEAPTFFDEKSYNYTYGLLPNELFNYIVNEQNIIDSEQIRVNGDGTYTQNFTLDPVASTFYYQFGMKTRGGLSGYPEFNSITFSVTFDGEWQILSAKMHEVAKVNKGILVDSISDFETQYWYGGERFDEEHYAYYESYFKNYLDESENLEQGGPTEDKLTIDVTNVLSNGFSQIMNGGAQFEIAVDLGANKYVGYAFVSLDLADPLGTLALKVSLGKTLREQTLYIEYGDGGLQAYYGNDFALTANLAEVKAKIDELSEIIDKISATFAKGGETAPEAPAEDKAPADGGDPLTELMNAMVLTAGEKQAVLTLDTDDLLGLGIGVNARLVFGINNNKITFRSANVGELSVGGEVIDLNLSLATTTAEEISRVPSETGADLAEYVADVYKLLGSDLLKVTAELDGDGEKVSIDALKGLGAKVTAYADIDGVTVGAEAEVSYTYKGQKVSAKAEIWYGYDPTENNYGKAVVSLTEFNGTPFTSPLKIKCDVKEVADAVSTLITFGGGDGGQATEGLVSILNGALSSDLSSLLTEMYADKAQIRVGLSVDGLLKMLGVNTGIKFGSCTLKYARGAEDAVYGGELSAALPALGLKLAVCGEGGAVSKPDDTDALDLVYLINDIKELATAELFKAHVTLDGEKLAENFNITQLSGLSAVLDVYLDPENLAVAADLGLSYKYGEDTVTVDLSAWYDRGESGSGNIVLSLNSINNAPLNAKVYCDIDEMAEAVQTLLQYANIKIAPFEITGGGDGAEIISAILGADFNALLPVLETGEETLKVGVNVDEALNLFNVDLGGFSLGNVTLAYDHGADSKLTADIPAVGLSAEISGVDGQLKAMPAIKDCFNLTNLVNTVNAVWGQVDGIIENQSVSFSMVRGENFLSLDGIIVEIWGDGEVSWKAGGEYVALDLSMSITEQRGGAVSEAYTDVLKLKLIYDKNAQNAPLVTLAFNNVGIEIYQQDIDSVKKGFNDIYNKVVEALGGETQTTVTSSDSETATDNGTGTDETGKKFVVTDKLLGVLFGVLADDGWVNFLNDFTLTSDGKSVALNYLADNSFDVELGADGGLSLFYDGAFGDRFSLSGGITASATVGDLRESIKKAITEENVKMSSSKTEGSAPFIKLAYDYLFEAISSIDVSHILGSDTYTVKFKLNGSSSGVKELEDVYINAEIYVTGKKTDANGKVQPKLSEANLDIDAKGVIIKLNVITERVNDNTHFYINLSKVMNIQLPDLKFLATQNSLYETFEVLFNAVNNTHILNDAAKLLGLDKTLTPAAPSSQDNVETAPATDEPLADMLADLITKLINFNFNEALNATESADGVMTATLDLDNILKQLGVEAGSLGKVNVVINHNNHSMTTSGKDGWISLSSELAARKTYTEKEFDRAQYISIEFLPDLIDDLLKVATDDEGHLNTSFTLSGSITANVVSILDVKLDPCTVTVNIGEDGLSLSLVTHVNKAKFIGIGLPESTIGLTYKNGLLTLGKKLNTASPEYKVVTFDYFADNLLSGDELLNWLLEISGWSLFKSYLPEVKSGLTTTQDVKLYEATEAKEDQEISMYTFVDALRVVIGGRPTAEFGNYDALESDLGVSDNYYGFALNAGAVTGGVLTKLNAAITRTDAGLDAVKASGAIQSYVTFSANLQFKESWKNEYQLGNDLQGEVTAPDLYDRALTVATAAGYTPNFDFFEQNAQSGYDKKFGCLSVSGGSYSVSYSNVLYSHKLIIEKANGEREERLVRHGSTVYLYDNNHPVYADDAKTVRVLYSTVNGEVGAASVLMNGDITVYEVRRAAVNVIVHNGSEEVIVNSFVGDKVPTTVTGLETIEKPVYADGTAVGDNDIIDGSSTEIHIYGTFVKTETVVNNVKYTFNAETMSYTASGKAAGFNDYYSTKGNTLVLENEIGGYPVTAIADNAFANTDGKPVKSVIVPENIVTVGRNAFLDNVGMESAVFLAGRVEMLGTGGKDKNDDKDQPFYGCTAEPDGTSSNLKIYYNEIVFCGSTTDTIWTKVRVQEASLGIKYRYYIGGKPSNENSYARDGGGALYGKGSWQYVDCAVNVNANGVIGGTLSEEAVKNILAPYFPYATTGSYAGSLTETNVNKAMEQGIADFTVLRGGITYACVYTAEVSVQGGRTTVTFSVSYKATAEIYVESPYAISLYGKNVAANTPTLMTVPVDGETIALPSPTEATHVFDGWDVAEKDGKLIYTAKWHEKTAYTLTIKLYRGGTDTNRVHIITNGVKPSEGIKVNGGVFSGSTTVTTVKVYEGQATFSIANDELTIVTGDITYVIYVNEAKVGGADKGTKRSGLKSTLADEQNISGNIELTLSYS